MSSVAQTLNLRPQEKRILAVIAFIVFVVLNLVLVFPHFKDYQTCNSQWQRTCADIAREQAAIKLDTKPGGLKDQLNALQNGKGGAVSSTEIVLQQTISDQARASGVLIQSISAPTKIAIGPGSLADKFFESQSVRIVLQSGEDALVKFLFNVGNDPAMIRVRELEMHPLDNNRYRLNASITLTADYQKTNAAKRAAPILTGNEAAAKTNAKPPTNAPLAPAARGISSTNNTNANPGPARKSATPPAPAPSVPPAVPLLPARSRVITPPAPGRTNAPAIPPRPPRVQN
jgi:hypothetical protein